jgi:predicted metal-binding protein
MPAAIRPVPRPWRELVLVCRKCTKKLDGGFGKGGRDSLRRLLRAELRAGGRDVRVVAVNCLGVCPKRAVSVMRGSRPGEVLVVPAGTDPADILHRLL